MFRFIFILFFLPVLSFAQLETYHVAPGFLVQYNFFGPDYTVSNVTYQGTQVAFAQFDATNTNLGLGKGLIMTTGTTYDNDSGPHGPNDLVSAGVDNGWAGYVPLSNLIGGVDTYNAAVLEFDIVPQVDSIYLRYIFGSEEYPEYVNAGFADAMAIYISGPGIPGQQNIALTPGGDPININTINAGANSAFYINNGDGMQAPYNSVDTVVQYDGYTKPLNALASGVQIGATYHMIFAIADVGDGAYDSGLFVESCAGCNFAVGLNDEDQSILRMFPNPAKTTFTIDFNEIPLAPVRMYNALGEEVKNIVASTEHLNIDVRDLSSGVYLVVIDTGEELVQERLIIE